MGEGNIHRSAYGFPQRRAKKTQREKKNVKTEKECWKQRKETVTKENANDFSEKENMQNTISSLTKSLPQEQRKKFQYN